VSTCRSYKYRVYPTVEQANALDRALRLQRELYNAALEERRGAWRLERRSVNYVQQCRTLTQLREVRPEVLDFGVIVCRGTLQRLDLAYRDFYRRCKQGEKPGYPRFKARGRFDSLQWEDTSGWKLKTDARRLHLRGIGHVKVKLHRELRGTPKAITVKREGRHWFVSVRCVDIEPTPLETTGREVGIDLGVVNLVATSDGELVFAGRFGRDAQAALAKAQRDLKLKKKGSNRRRHAVERVAQHHRKVRNQRRDLAHKVSRRLVNDYDFIVLEDLKVANMVSRPKPRPCSDGTFEPNGATAKSGLNRSIQDAGWAQLTRMLVYKAADAGRELRVVPPHFTSQRCSRCEHVDEASRRSQAVFRCTACGYQAHADVNAACNVLWAGRAQRTASARAG
jgi:putative transposase